MFPGALLMEKGGSLNKAQFIPDAQDLSELVLPYPANMPVPVEMSASFIELQFLRERIAPVPK